MAVKPITPDDLADREFPDEVIEAFNELIVEGAGRVVQREVVDRIVSKMCVTDGEIFEKGWLNVEETYRKAGWDVVYDKPGFNETYRAFFMFTRKR